MGRNSNKSSNSSGDLEQLLNTLRGRIDTIDKSILELLNQRLNVAKEIGECKGRSSEIVMDSARETNVMKRLFSLNEGPMSNEAIQHIFTEIFGSSREAQQPHMVSYLGPEATFTHIAAKSYFGKSATFVPQASIRDVFQAVEKGEAHYGIVPVENSIEGAVNYTLDLFYESELKICAETYLNISHDLLSVAGSLKDIEVVYSHPQALAQCRKWLRKYLPDVAIQEVGSTAEAARTALSHDRTAAIASSEAAQMYQLNVMASKIEDVSKNTTRFLVIGKKAARPTGMDKTSIMFVTPHTPGALYKVMTPIAEAGLNMVKLESRPSRQENWTYIFFLDVEGHIDQPELKDTVEKVRQMCLFTKWLGSYPIRNRVEA
jgi:chorismate mutase/prephenate dehydratase